tara:strand:+ start:583 stop:1032 length:450 start_codon:yes stop_codon:yes gene_type:complete
MKAADFAKILKKIIKEEVRTVIRQELREALKTNKQPVRDIQSTTHAPVTQKPIPQTGNISLDGILAETANAVRNGTSAMIEDDQAYPDMASQFTADQAQGFGHMMNHMNQHDEPAPTQPAMVNPNDPTAAFMKDYSGVLKTAEAINSKK